ncbi:MAG: hypothetical protein QM820_21995 [Minicystis sp.]
MRFTLVAVSAVALATLAGCSEPVPQSADGAFFIATSQPDPSVCIHVGHTTQVGTVDSTQRTTVVTDGVDGINVSCTVESLAGSMTPPYLVKGKIDALSKSGNYMELLIPSISPNAKPDAPAQGSVVFSDPKTAGNPYSGPCDFYFEQSNQTVDNGRAWLSFKCAELTSSMSKCPLTTGYVILENCLTESVEE